LKKFSGIILVLLNLSCTALTNPQEQPVNLIDDINKIYLTTCSGLAETSGTCHIKAKRTCFKTYKVLDEIIDSSGLQRQLRFQCKE
jgi:hypothetical protein